MVPCDKGVFDDIVKYFVDIMKGKGNALACGGVIGPGGPGGPCRFRDCRCIAVRYGSCQQAHSKLVVI